MKSIVREPLVYFLLSGAILFFLVGFMSDDESQRIVVTEAERSRLSSQWQAQMGRPPTPRELGGLIEQWVREEIYYREAVAMGLDENDVIIRRRLAQKLTFLTEDLGIEKTPDVAALREFYEQHSDRYREPTRYSFKHRYFSGEGNEPENAARKALERMSHGTVPDGDPFMMQLEYAQRSEREIAEEFGREFAEAVSRMTPGRWQGPVRSAYGWHLVEVDARVPARLKEFEEIAEQVQVDFRQHQRRRANEAYYESLRSRYQVVDA